MIDSSKTWRLSSNQVGGKQGTHAVAGIPGRLLAQGTVRKLAGSGEVRRLCWEELEGCKESQDWASTELLSCLGPPKSSCAWGAEDTGTWAPAQPAAVQSVGRQTVSW